MKSSVPGPKKALSKHLWASVSDQSIAAVCQARANWGCNTSTSTRIKAILLNKTLTTESLFEFGFLSQWLVMSASPMITCPPVSSHRASTGTFLLAQQCLSLEHLCTHVHFSHPCLSFENHELMLICPLVSSWGVFVSMSTSHQCLRTSVSACHLPASVFLWRVHAHMPMCPPVSAHGATDAVFPL